VESLIDTSIESSSPPHWDDAQRAWIITRYSDAMRILKSAGVDVVDGGKELERISNRLGQAYPHLAAILAGTPILQNPPNHNQSRMWLKESISQLASRCPAEAVECQAASLLGDLEEGSQDLVRLLADALPNGLLAAYLEVGIGTIRWLRQEGAQIVEAWHPVPLREYARIEKSAERVRDCFSRSGVRSAQSARVAARNPHAAKLCADLLDGTMFFLLAGAIETTAAFLGNAIHLLSEDLALQLKLRENPHRIGDFVEEALRFCGPLKRIAPRITRQEIDLSGSLMQPGATMIIKLESIHRDPSVFPDPDRFDLDRKNTVPVIAFSAGAHGCLGAALARLEARILLSKLLEEFMILPGEAPPRRRASPDFRQFETLPLILKRIGQSMPAGEGPATVTL
jgi:cytochrome P450